MKEVQNFEDGVWRLTVTVVDLTKKKKNRAKVGIPVLLQVFLPPIIISYLACRFSFMYF